jgi:hypothetical protein
MSLKNLIKILLVVSFISPFLWSGRVAAYGGSIWDFCTQTDSYNDNGSPYCRSSQRDGNAMWFSSNGQGDHGLGQLRLNPINFSKPNGYLVLYTNYWDYNFLVTVNGAATRIKFNPAAGGMTYLVGGSNQLRIMTNIKIYQNDQISVLLEHPDNPGVECSDYNNKFGFCKEPGDSAIWRVQADSSDLAPFFNSYSADIDAQPIVELVFPDPNLRKNDANDGYQYFYDQDIQVLLGIYGSLGPPCDPGGDVTMSVNPNPQYELLQSTFQVTINKSNVSIAANPTINGATLVGQIQHNGNTYSGTFNMSGAPGNYSWTVAYNKGSAAEGGVSSCSKTESFTILETPPPDCDYGTPYPIVGNPSQTNSGDAIMSVAPFPQVRYNSAIFRVNKGDLYDRDNSDPNRKGDMLLDSITISPALVNSCLDKSGTRLDYKWLACNVIGPEGTYQWTVSYRLFAKGKAPSGRSNTCVKTSVFGIQDPPGYLITRGGDTYIKSGINMPSYEKWGYTKCIGVTRNRCLAEYLWATNTNQNTACKNCSTKNYSKQNSYLDQNLTYINYDTISSMVLDRASKNSSITIVKNVSSDSFASTDRRVVVLNNDLTISSGTVCNTPTIYFVPGDLTIAPDFTIKNATNALSKGLGCVFVVKGDLNILGGSVKGENGYDLIHGFFILTENTSTVNIAQDNYESLRIVGGLVMRDVNLDNIKRKPMGLGRPITELQPAEVIEYEGGRYINIFGDILLDNQAVYNIKEAPFIETFK